MKTHLLIPITIIATCSILLGGFFISTNIDNKLQIQYNDGMSKGLELGRYTESTTLVDEIKKIKENDCMHPVDFCNSLANNCVHFHVSCRNYNP